MEIEDLLNLANWLRIQQFFRKIRSTKIYDYDFTTRKIRKIFKRTLLLIPSCYACYDIRENIRFVEFDSFVNGSRVFLRFQLYDYRFTINKDCDEKKTPLLMLSWETFYDIHENIINSS